MPFTPRSAVISKNLSQRSAGVLCERSNRRSPWEVARSNSCLELRVTEQLKVSRLGSRGDGIADTSDGPVYVPSTLPGETVTAQQVAGHPDRRHLLHVDRSSHERAQPICKHFGICG